MNILAICDIRYMSLYDLYDIRMLVENVCHSQLLDILFFCILMIFRYMKC